MSLFLSGGKPFAERLDSILREEEGNASTELEAVGDSQRGDDLQGEAILHHVADAVAVGEQSTAAEAGIAQDERRALPADARADAGALRGQSLAIAEHERSASGRIEPQPFEIVRGVGSGGAAPKAE